MSSAPRSISVLMIEDALMSSFSSSLNPDWAASFSTKEDGSGSMARDKCLNRIGAYYLEANDRNVNKTNVYTSV